MVTIGGLKLHTVNLALQFRCITLFFIFSHLLNAVNNQTQTQNENTLYMQRAAVSHDSRPGAHTQNSPSHLTPDPDV